MRLFHYRQGKDSFEVTRKMSYTFKSPTKQRVHSSRHRFTVHGLMLFIAHFLFFTEPASATTTCAPVTANSVWQSDPANYGGPRVAGAVIGRVLVTANVTCTGLTVAVPPNPQAFARFDFGFFRDGTIIDFPSNLSGINLRIDRSSRISSGCDPHVRNPFSSSIGELRVFFNSTTGSCSSTISVAFDLVLTGQPIRNGQVMPNLLQIGIDDLQGNARISARSPASTLAPIFLNLNTTCQIRNSTQTVTLPTIQASTMSIAGQTAGRTAHTIFVDNCTFPALSGPYRSFMNFNYTPGPVTNTIANSSASPAANVTVQALRQSNLAPVANGSTIDVNVTAPGTYTYPLYFEYRATGAAGPGQYSGQMQIFLSYL